MNLLRFYFILLVVIFGAVSEMDSIDNFNKIKKDEPLHFDIGYDFYGKH